MGVGVDSAELPQLLEVHSALFTTRIEALERLSSDKKLYRTRNAPIMEGTLRASKATGESLLAESGSQLVLDIFDYKAPPAEFPDGVDALYDPAFGVISLAVAPGDSDIIELSGQALDVNAALQSMLFEADIKNPISEMKKGNITVKARSKIQDMLAMQKLQAMNGDLTVVVDCTRYSEGKVKGKRDDI